MQYVYISVQYMYISIQYIYLFISNAVKMSETSTSFGVVHSSRTMVVLLQKQTLSVSDHWYYVL